MTEHYIKGSSGVVRPGSGDLNVTDGITTVKPTNKITFTGATVTDLGSGEAGVEISSATASFSSARMYKFAVEHGSSVIWGSSTLAIPDALTTDYDADGYWDATNRRFNITTTGVYAIFFNSEVSFQSGLIGSSGDLLQVGLLVNHTHHGADPKLQFNMYGQNTGDGSFYWEDVFTAGDWIKVYYNNPTSHNAIWDSITYCIRRID